MACVAACIRYYIYQIVTGGGCPSDQDMKDVISRMDEALADTRKLVASGK